jgi:hypothetical protein
MNSIIYITDNTLAPEIDSLCRRILVREAREIPIISVSQKPVDLGHNVCVGEIGRNWISLYKQLLAGAAEAETDWVVVVEHDCLYTYEHLSYQPDDPGVFWYNHNCWLVQWGGNHPELNGMYSYWPRRLALSQLICHKALLKQSIDERLEILERGGRMDRQFLGCGEPGVVSDRALHKARQAAESGKPIQLQRYLKDYLQRYEHKTFGTVNPNLDIRHGTNFTGPKRGKMRTYELPYWGKFEDVRNA